MGKNYTSGQKQVYNPGVMISWFILIIPFNTFFFFTSWVKND